MSLEEQQKSMQKPILNIGTETTKNLSVNRSRKRKNNKNPKFSNSLISEIKIHSEINEREITPREQTAQNPAEDTGKKAVKKMYTISFMLGLRNLPMCQIEPECLKNFEELRITKPDVELDVNTQYTPNQSGFNLRPCYSGNSKYHNNGPNRMNNFEYNNYTNNNNFYVNNTRPEHHHFNRPRPHNDGYRGPRNIYNNTNLINTFQQLQDNRFDFNRQPQNREYYNNNSRYSNTNNAGLRNSGRFNNNTDRFKRNNISVYEDVKKRTVIHYSLATNNKVELNSCKNAWVPSCRNSQKLTQTNEAETEEILKKVRSILNKITPETMTVLTKSIIDMQINTYDCLSKMIELLFQKAIDEPNFTPQYAYICSQMKDLEVRSTDNNSKTSFKQLILLKCQSTFELVSDLEKNAADSLTAIEVCKDQALKKELQLKYDENERIQRKRSVGNCRFMCEMFKVKLINSKVMEMCVGHLLGFPKEEPLECLCNILKHIGKYLNSGSTYQKLKEYTSTSYKTKISSRIRFMILDTIELKDNNWVPRNAVIKPKTLNEIENEFTSNQTNFECNLTTKIPSNIYLNSNIPKVNSQSFEIQIESELCPSKPKHTINGQKKTILNSEESEIEHCSALVKNSDVELNTCKNAWVPRFRNSQKSTVSNPNEINIEDIENKVQKLPKSDTSIQIVVDSKQNEIIEQMTVNDSNSVKMEIEHCSPTKINSNEVKLNTSMNAWIPRFRTSHKLTGDNEKEVKKIEKTVQELPKLDIPIKTTTDNKQLKNYSSQQKSVEGSNALTCPQKEFISRYISKRTISKCEEKQEISVKITTNMPLKIEKKCNEFPKSVTDIKQGSFETFHSIVYSMTQENIISSSQQLTSSISSIEHIEETIDVLFKRAINEPNRITLIVEMCSLIKVIVLKTDKGTTHVSFKKHLAARCRKLLKIGNFERNSETQNPIPSKATYTMIGELFNKKLLPLNIMVEFIKDIPNRLTNESIGNICYFLKIIGENIDRPYSLKLTIKRLETYVNNDVEGLIPQICKEEVKDLIKIRNNKWISVIDGNINRSH